MTIQRVVIKAHLRIQRQQITGTGDHQRIDLNQAGIKRGESAIEAAKEFRQLLCRCAADAHDICQTTAMMRLQTGRRIDIDRENLLRLRGRNLFNIHTAFA